MTSDDGTRDAATKPKGDSDDLLEAPTQSIPVSQGQRSSGEMHSGVAGRSDTTTWGGAPPPSVSLDEDETVVSSVPQESEPDPEATDNLIAASPGDPAPSAPIAPSSSLRPMLLERIEPSLGRGERLRLDATHWRVSLGRAEDSDIRLYTVSASRDHALIAGSESGDWVLTPATGRSVLIDGEPVAEPVVLEVGMNLILGQDHLRCVTEGLDRKTVAAVTVAEGFTDSTTFDLGRFGKAGLFVGAVILIGIVAWAFSTLSGA